MTKITLNQLPRTYKNNGQHAEQLFRYTMCGEICKADNKQDTDYQDIQIKSSRATVCKGTDIAKHIAQDKAKKYAYVTSDFSNAYIMSKAEYLEFTSQFSSITTESKKNGGAIKTRLKEENKAMLNYLEGKI
jgi:hypothetical protein